MTFGQRLVELREEQGYTRQQFCQKVELPYNTYRNYEADAREPAYAVLCRIANVLNVSTDYLLCRTDIRQPALQLDEEESRLILNFRRLDSRGKATVNASTASQLSYCESGGGAIPVSKGGFDAITHLHLPASAPIAARGGVSPISEEDQRDAEKISRMFFSEEGKDKE
ncbi:helix-turn-helix domain-containing protein [Zongyangia hominis]|uniref:Helix-turn-helix transcriptional regulator n=1 Tax=Zongyangia hominis TaxID=2763677 RepID=A0A926I6C6_9FIRM|nr:helix-turn-helix transcriptional regulator [Zongyangia hominis]MBC8569909.1 helix-turn-helix transcriptional regulator [Zongyangia hominis]